MSNLKVARVDLRNKLDGYKSYAGLQLSERCSKGNIGENTDIENKFRTVFRPAIVKMDVSGDRAVACSFDQFGIVPNKISASAPSGFDVAIQNRAMFTFPMPGVAAELKRGSKPSVGACSVSVLRPIAGGVAVPLLESSLQTVDKRVKS